MPLYMDCHRDIRDTTPQDFAEAHLKDLEVQGKYGVRYVTYWFDETAGTAFCLVDAPSKERAEAVHRKSHGMVATKIIEVDQSAVEEFLGKIADTPAAIDPATTEMQFGLRIILFTDMEASTASTQRLGDARAMDLLRTHNEMVREALQALGGREVKHTGDGIMASFMSAARALECAIAIQKAFADHNQSAEEPMRVRIGLNAGEPVAEDGDLFGTAVQLAARVCAQAEPGQILAPVVVRELAAGKGILFADRGETALRGFEESMRLYEVKWK